MSLTTSVPPPSLWLTKGSEHVRSFGRWWLREFLALFPGRVADWLIERGSRTLVLATEEDAVTFRLMSDRRRVLASARVALAEYSADVIDDFLKTHRLRRRDVSLGIGLPQSAIFCRSFVLPLETRRSLDAIAVQDLTAKTPFQLDGIFHAHVARRTADKFLVWQWVVRRSHLAHAVEALGLDLGDIAFVESPDARADDGPLPIIALRRSAASRNRWVTRTAVTLAAMALLLIVTAISAKYHRQQLLLDSLQAEVASATAKAKSVKTAIDKLQQELAILLRLRSRRSEPGLLDLWEEATRILPAHTWLSELRLSESPDGRQVVMTGFSAAAAALVGLLDRSPLFSEASLAGPITLDQAENKERFVIQANVSNTAKPKTASR